jgi:hypothetical protein
LNWSATTVILTTPAPGFALVVTLTFAAAA